MRKILIEICCGSVDDVIEAFKAGADRVELNSAMSLGGLTPTVGALRTAKASADIPVVCMVRPREGGFSYTDNDFNCMLCDAEVLLENGADGLVFGFLNGDGSVDAEKCRIMVDLAGNKQTVFSRAIDVVPNWMSALDILIELKVTRVLTSGQMPSVFAGAPTVAEMINYASGRIEILPGAGIKADNVIEVIEKTGCGQIHLSMHKMCYDHSTSCRPEISFSAARNLSVDCYKTVDRAALIQFVKKLRG